MLLETKYIFDFKNIFYWTSQIQHIFNIYLKYILARKKIFFYRMGIYICYCISDIIYFISKEIHKVITIKLWGNI